MKLTEAERDEPHSPLPWRVEDFEDNTSETSQRIVAADGTEVCSNEPYYPVAVTAADMRFIIGQQRTIDALVAALEEVSKLRRVLRDEGLLEQVEDALALARKGG